MMWLVTILFYALAHHLDLETDEDDGVEGGIVTPYHHFFAFLMVIAAGVTIFSVENAKVLIVV